MNRTNNQIELINNLTNAKFNDYFGIHTNSLHTKTFTLFRNSFNHYSTLGKLI